jgi:hypothetical protein
MLKKELGGLLKRKADLSEKMNEIVSRRQTFSLMGLATAVLALAVPTTVLIVAEEAEAQTAGMVRRQDRQLELTDSRPGARPARNDGQYGVVWRQPNSRRALSAKKEVRDLWLARAIS